MKQQTITAVVIGAGNRGREVYGQYALDHPNDIKIVAIAEPNDIRRKKMANEHQIPSERQFTDYKELFKREKIADAAIICTQDQMHTRPALMALDKGYEVLLEKPMAVTPEDCVKLVKKSEETGKQLRIAHVLRYNEFFNTIYQSVNSRMIGEIITIDHRENVSYYHMAHSFVRGNWSNRETSSPMILAKSCHDLDILYWLVSIQQGKPIKISSFGSLKHFTPDNAPEGAPKRCTDGCPVKDNCKYYAPRIYIDIVPLLRILQRGGSGMPKIIANLSLKHKRIFNSLKKVIPSFRAIDNYCGWPVSTITDDCSLQGKWKALKEGSYGRCVYYCNNNVVDHQVTTIEFDNRVTVTFTMHGFSHYEGRTIRIDGTKGTLIGEAYSHRSRIVFYDHLKGTKEILLDKKIGKGTDSGHGGGDAALMKSFIDSLRNSDNEPLTGARASLESHMMAFAAEESRLTDKIIFLEDFKLKYQ